MGLLTEEVVFLGGFRDKVREFKNRDQLAEYLGLCLSTEPGQTKKHQRAQGKAFLEECGGTAESLINLADAARSYYEELAKRPRCPRTLLPKLMDVEGKRIDKIQWHISCSGAGKMPPVRSPPALPSRLAQRCHRHSARRSGCAEGSSRPLWERSVRVRGLRRWLCVAVPAPAPETGSFVDRREARIGQRTFV